MIDELVNDGKSERQQRVRRSLHTRGHFYRNQLHDEVPDGSQQQQTDASCEEDIRLPWTHKSDPLDSHPLNVLPSVNHVELPFR